MKNSKWKILIVDDERDQQEALYSWINDFIIEGKELDIIFASSGTEAIKILQDDNPEYPEIAMLFLDVVMEKDEAGFEVAKYLKESLKNTITQVVIRTAQAGKKLSTIQDIIRNHDIDDFIEKGDDSQDRLFSVIYGRIRQYISLCSLNDAINEKNVILDTLVVDMIKPEIDIRHKEKSLFILIENLLKKFAASLGKESVELTKEETEELILNYGDNSNALLSVLFNIIKDSDKSWIAKMQNQLSKGDIKWAGEEIELYYLYLALSGENHLFDQNYNICFIKPEETNWALFSAHFNGRSPKIKINWYESQLDLICFIFKLNYHAVNHYLQDNFEKTINRAIGKHFTIEGREVNPNTVKAQKSNNSELLIEKHTNEGKIFVKDPKWIGDNVNASIISDIITNCLGIYLKVKTPDKLMSLYAYLTGQKIEEREYKTIFISCKFDIFRDIFIAKKTDDKIVWESTLESLIYFIFTLRYEQEDNFFTTEFDLLTLDKIVYAFFCPSDSSSFSLNEIKSNRRKVVSGSEERPEWIKDNEILDDLREIIELF
jgi:CheY-like chemotaxis protein